MLSRSLRTLARRACFKSSTVNTGRRSGVSVIRTQYKSGGAFESSVDRDNCTILASDTNQVKGLAEFARFFIDGDLGKGPDASVLKRVDLFNTDALLCGLSALSMQCNAPTVLQREALEYTVDTPSEGAQVLGHSARVRPEKATVANCSAVREWDSNGTVFGFNNRLGKSFQAGEFGHNDYYPTVIAAAQQRGLNGEVALKAMVLHDEIRGRLAEVFSLKTYKIDHVVHGAIATAVVYGTLMGATLEEIESAVGMTVAHYIPFRAIRAGHQLSDSKGASAAVSSEVAVLSVHRAMRGFVGPMDVFRNPQAIFRLFEPTASDDESPFDLVLSHSGNDFAVMSMHFKLGLYEHQSAGAIQGLLNALSANPSIIQSLDNLNEIEIEIYEPAFGIIGDPAKRTPTTRQSADHSMVYIISSIVRKALELGPSALSECGDNGNDIWKQLMLLPKDYDSNALYDSQTRAVMDKIKFVHNPEYDDLYPKGIPTQMKISCKDGTVSQSGLVMYPGGHAGNEDKDLEGILAHKFRELGKISFEESEVDSKIKQLSNLGSKTADELQDLYNIPYLIRDPPML